MLRPLNFLLFVFIFFSACKKDLLHYQSVQKLDSHSDSDRLNKIIFLDDNTGFIVGGQRFAEGVILTTHDGGYSWQKQINADAQKGLYDIVQSPTGAIYTCGFDGKLLHSNDTGKTWIFNQLEYFAFTGLAFTDAAHLVMVGGVSFSSGIREYADTTGRLIKRDSLPYQFNKIRMVSGATGYLCGYGIMMRTDDSCKTWRFQGVQNDNYTDMDVHNREIWMCGYNGSIVYTADGGESWVRFRNGNDLTLPRYHLYGIIFKDSQNGWAVGEKGVVIHSDDGGRHWAEYDRFTNSTLRNIAICPNGDLLVAGDNGALYRIQPR